MRAVADPVKFEATIRASHDMKSTATLIPFSGPVVELPGLIDGTVTLDGTAETRGQVSLMFVDDGTMGLVPTESSSLLAPYSNEIQVRRGLLMPDGTEQLVSLGIFRIQDSKSNETEDGDFTISVTGFDRSKKISDAKFLKATQIPGGTDYLQAMRDQITIIYPKAEFIFPTLSGFKTPLINISEGDDRWQLLLDMAAAIGYDLYVDGDGVFVLKLVPSLTGPNFDTELVEGEGGLLTSASPDWTREGAFNAVIYTGENTSTDGDPPRGEAYDLDPLSPTYFNGPFGQVPTFETSSFLINNSMAQQAAEGKLNKELGTSKSIDFGSIVNPRIEPDDIAFMKRERIGINETHIIDSVVIPLMADSGMDGHTRSRLVDAEQHLHMAVPAGG